MHLECNRKKDIFLCFLGGGLYSMGFPSLFAHQSVIICLLGLFLFIYSLSELSIKLNIKNSIIFSLSFFSLSLYWLPNTLKNFNEIESPYNYISIIFLSFLIVPQLYIVSFLYPIYRKKIFKWDSSAAGISFVIAFLSSSLSFIIPSEPGLAWVSLAPYLFLAPIGGVMIYSFLSYWILFSLKRYTHGYHIPKTFLAFVPLLLLLHLFFPIKLKNKGENFNIRLTQGKALSEDEDGGLSIYKKLSNTKSEEPLDLIIWPESSFPHSINIKHPQKTQNISIIKNIAQEKKSYIFFGANRINETTGNISFEGEYNSAFLFSPNGKYINHYDKMYLVPFGESLPFGSKNQDLMEYFPNVSFFKKGESFTLFQLSKKALAVSSICYEILFSSHLRAYLNYLDVSPHFVINLTNDIWLGNTIAPKQHEFYARWRSLEFQLPVVRVNNSGYSSILFPDGSHSQSLQYLDKGVLDEKLYITPKKATLYQRYGLFITIFLFICISILEFFIMKLKILIFTIRFT